MEEQRVHTSILPDFIFLIPEKKEVWDGGGQSRSLQLSKVLS